MFDPLYLALSATTAMYAVILQKFKERLEPDWTWLEVAIGVCLCLLAAAIYARWHRAPWQEYERAVWWAFIYGGAPIIMWQLWRQRQRVTEALDYLRRQRNGNTATEVAERRGGSQE